MYAQAARQALREAVLRLLPSAVGAEAVDCGPVTASALRAGPDCPVLGGGFTEPYASKLPANVGLLAEDRIVRA